MSEATTAATEPEELRMSLGEHLQELRTRLMKCTGAVLVLGVASLVFAKPLFGLLMRPVLEALPPEGRSLVYTSGIEEINVLMKVGLYAGLFLSTPVILWQLWGFVAPGLYPSERRFASPFVAFGSMAFVAGAAFCYFVLLPTMFQFLLQGENVETQQQTQLAGRREEDVLRLLSLGATEQAGALARTALTELGVKPTAEGSPAVARGKVEVVERAERLGRLVQAASGALGPKAKGVLVDAIDRRQRALTAIEKGELAEASGLLDGAAAALGSAAATGKAELHAIWELQASLASAQARDLAQNWTKPMLSMREQLSLVLLLLLALGIIFELPVVIALLAAIGVVKASFLMKYQRHAFVVCLILAAIITPTGDAVNLALMGGPMILCYELGVLAAWLIERRRKKAAATTAISPAG